MIDAFDESGVETNYGWSFQSNNGNWWSYNQDFGVNDVDLNGTNSSFKLRLGSDYVYRPSGQYYDYGYQPNAAAISKITVQSMKYFPENYYADNAPGPGVSPDYDW